MPRDHVAFVEWRGAGGGGGGGTDLFAVLSNVIFMMLGSLAEC